MLLQQIAEVHGGFFLANSGGWWSARSVVCRICHVEGTEDHIRQHGEHDLSYWGRSQGTEERNMSLSVTIRVLSLSIMSMLACHSSTIILSSFPFQKLSYKSSTVTASRTAPLQLEDDVTDGDAR